MSSRKNKTKHLSKCLLCEKPRLAIIKSHVIPAASYRNLGEDKVYIDFSTKEINLSPKEDVKRLFCHDCDNGVIGKYESLFYDALAFSEKKGRYALLDKITELDDLCKTHSNDKAIRFRVDKKHKVGDFKHKITMYALTIVFRAILTKNIGGNDLLPWFRERVLGDKSSGFICFAYIQNPYSFKNNMNVLNAIIPVNNITEINGVFRCMFSMNGVSFLCSFTTDFYDVSYWNSIKMSLEHGGYIYVFRPDQDKIYEKLFNKIKELEE
jgi:hypothetical protein